MKILRFFRAALLVSHFSVLMPTAASAADPIVFTAVADFTTLKVEGFVQTRIEADKGTIAVDGDITGYSFGMAQTTFRGEDGVYDVTLETVQDGDGVCDYYLRIGKVDTSRFRQTGTENGAVENHTWKGLTIRRGDPVGVAGNASDTKQNAPGKGPKGFHMAHGRWSKITFVQVGPSP